MRTGDQENILQRLKVVLPAWFGDDTPNLDAILNAYSVTAAYNYRLYEYLKLQTRIKTATDDNLDLISRDYLGNRLPRRKNEDDNSFRNRILAFLLPFPATREGISDAIYALTGRRPDIFEPWNVNDTGALNNDFYLNISQLGALPDAYEATFFITVYRPIAEGSDWPALNNDFYLGFDSYLWSPQLIGRQVADEDILAIIQATKACGVTALVEILD